MSLDILLVTLGIVRVPTFCCASIDKLRMAVHCNGCFVGATGRLHARHVKVPKALTVGRKVDMAELGVQESVCEVVK